MMKNLFWLTLEKIFFFQAKSINCSRGTLGTNIFFFEVKNKKSSENCSKWRKNDFEKLLKKKKISRPQKSEISLWSPIGTKKNFFAQNKIRPKVVQNDEKLVLRSFGKKKRKFFFLTEKLSRGDPLGKNFLLEKKFFLKVSQKNGKTIVNHFLENFFFQPPKKWIFPLPSSLSKKFFVDFFWARSTDKSTAPPFSSRPSSENAQKLRFSSFPAKFASPSSPEPLSSFKTLILDQKIHQNFPPHRTHNYSRVSSRHQLNSHHLLYSTNTAAAAV